MEIDEILKKPYLSCDKLLLTLNGSTSRVATVIADRNITSVNPELASRSVGPVACSRSLDHTRLNETLKSMYSKKLTTSPVAVAGGLRGLVNFMKTNSVCLLLAVAGMCMAQMNASAQPVSVAGTYKHINIDGDFSDWAGVPLASDEARNVGDVVSFQNLYVANDEDYIYIRFSLYRAANPFTSKSEHLYRCG